MAGGKKSARWQFFFFFTFLLVDGLYHKRAVLCCSRGGIKQKKKGGGEGRLGWWIGRERVLRLALGVLAISFSEGISGAGAKKFPSFGVLPANWSSPPVFFLRWCKSSQLVVQGVSTALRAPPNRGLQVLVALLGRG
jgi:hypothetical protein